MALIEIGSNKQPFEDDNLIESMKNARQVVNPVEKVAHNSSSAKTTAGRD